MTKLKKAFAIVMALAMVFAMSSAVFAAEPNVDTNAYYYQNDNDSKYAQTESITVYVTVESGKAVLTRTYISERRIPVTLEVPEGSDSKVFSVTDALVELQKNTTYGLTFLDSSSEELEPGDTYFYTVKQNGKEYGPSGLLSFDGWQVRVNDRYIIDQYMESMGGLVGETINTMYLEDGDDIHLYMSDTQSESAAVRYTKVVPAYENGTLSINVQESHDYFGTTSPYPWTITDFAAYSGLSSFSYTIYDADGSAVKTGTGSNCSASADISDLAEGTYTVVVNSVFSSRTLKSTMAYATFTK